MDKNFPENKLLNGETSQEHLWIKPGEIFVARHYSSLNTVVGSGIVLCVWNPEFSLGGMNHFLFPTTADAKKATARFGNVAMFKLFEMMHKNAAFGSLEAHIIGGAWADEFEEEIAKENAAVAELFCINEGITIADNQTGGNVQRSVNFNLTDGEVALNIFCGVSVCESV